MQAGLQKYVLYEASVPEPVRFEGLEHSRLNVAAVKRVWGEIKVGSGPDAVHANAGFWWDETRQTRFRQL